VSLLQGSTIPTVEALMDLGLFGWLIFTIVVLAVGPVRGWFYTPGRFEDMKDTLTKERDEARAERDALREENGQQHRDLLRVTDDFKNMTLNVIGAVVGKRTDA